VTKPLVVVESPTKVRTVKKYLGKNYNVAATVGHIKDLPNKEMGIDIENGFKPKYKNIPGKQKIIKTLKQAAGDAADIFLAPDPDREGEAIAWHTFEVLQKKGRKFYRVLFHELTKDAIQRAMASPESLDRPKYEAQQARRILDRLVGYQISPLLWRKVKGGLSAGRVQSVALRIICERERAIHAFESREYWSVTAHLEGESPPPFTAKLAKKNNDKIEIPNEEKAKVILADLEDKKFVVKKIIKKTTRKNPLPPFTTSKLQQDAIRKLRFSAKKTMLIAQQLYEGIELGPGEPVGLITYMRTDSTRIAKEAADEALRLIREKFGDAYALERPRFFKNRKKAQDAHEAIRPTSVSFIPDKVAPHLSKDQLALYRLIWQRFVASQMSQALINQVSVKIAAGPYQFAASGSTVKFPGFMALYMSVDDEIANKDQKKTSALPELWEGLILKLLQLEPKQHFTMPPPRFSEASLVKELEENGIGRPSTYASILSSEAESAEILAQFYNPFKKDLDAASEDMLSVKGVGLPTGLNCPECGKQLHIKVGKNGHFLACSGYPDCNYSRDYTRDEKGNIQAIETSIDEVVDKSCDKCGSPMVIKRGRYGEFLACSAYPDCKNTQSLNSNGANSKIGVKCPQNGCAGEIVERKSKRGKIFYGCNQFPKCEFATWDKPVAQECPECGAKILVEKTTKKDGTFLTCLTKECGYRKNL
jgi:DNA topoisomerase-1